MSWQQEEAFDEWLDKISEPIELFGMQYAPSRVLRLVDAIAYRELFLDWLDDNGEGEDEEGEDEEGETDVLGA